MAVCAQYRIPHSHFHGGPPRWTSADRDKAIWWYLREQERCGECGTRRSEWDEKLGGDRDAYKAVVVRCRGCEVTQQTQGTINEKQDGKGLGVSLRRR